MNTQQIYYERANPSNIRAIQERTSERYIPRLKTAVNLQLWSGNIIPADVQNISATGGLLLIPEHMNQLGIHAPKN